jgi:hypothetical protein
VPLTEKPTIITQKIKDILIAELVPVDLKAVYYGEQTLIPSYPAVVVESYPMEREITGTHTFGVTLRTGIIVFHGKLQPPEVTKKECEELIELITETLHADHTLDGLVVFGYINRVDPGVAIRGGPEGASEMYRASRVTWEGLSRVVF